MDDSKPCPHCGLRADAPVNESTTLALLEPGWMVLLDERGRTTAVRIPPIKELMN